MTDDRFDECMQRMCTGDKNALKEIYDDYLSYVYSIIYGVLKNKEDAEDVTSDFFIKLWSNSEKYVPGTGHKGYMATIARNMSIDFIRKHKREVLISDFEAGYDEEHEGGTMQISESAAPPGSMDITSNVENEVIGDISIKEAIAKLKPAQQEIVNMKIMGDMTFKEISEALNIPMGTVTWHYREAVKLLKRCGYE